MKNAAKSKVLILLTLLLVSCIPATKEERETIITLNAKFSSYEFSKHRDLSDAYLCVKVVEPFVDSVELKEIYQEIDSIKSNAINQGKAHINWTYLVVSDRENKYLFTIVENDSIVFFEDKVM